MSLTRIGSLASARILAAASRPDIGRSFLGLTALAGFAVLGAFCPPAAFPFLPLPPDVPPGGTGLAALATTLPLPEGAPPSPTSPAWAGLATARRRRWALLIVTLRPVSVLTASQPLCCSPSQRSWVMRTGATAPETLARYVAPVVTSCFFTMLPPIWWGRAPEHPAGNGPGSALARPGRFRRPRPSRSRRSAPSALPATARPSRPYRGRGTPGP